MSFILDALRKAERDQQRGKAPNMDDVMHAPPAPSADARQSWPWGLMALVLALLALVLWLLPETKRRLDLAASPPVTVESERDAAPVTERAAQADNQRNSGSKTPVAQALPDQALAANDQVPEETIVANSFDDLMGLPEPIEDRSSDVQAAPIAANKNVTEVVSSTGPESAAEQKRPATVLEAPAQPLPQTAATAESDRGTARPLREMPDRYRAGFPALSVDVHVYDPEPDKRWVLIGGRRYREGQSLDGGASLEQIVAEGVLVRFKGETVLVSVGQ